MKKAVFYLFLFLFFHSLKSGSAFEFLKDLKLVLPESQKFFTLPTEKEKISRTDFNGRAIFILNQKSVINLIYKGTISFVDKQNGIVFIETNLHGHKVIIKYFGLTNIVVQKNQNLKQDQKIGEANSKLMIEVKIEDMTINMLEHLQC